MALGRPLRYETPEDMQKAIDEYFKVCEGHVLLSADGEAVTDKGGLPIIAGTRPPTVTGLALALGFTGRQSLLDYQKRGKFLDTVTRAKSRVEEYAEGRLYDKDGLTGAKFTLINNFKGWSEKAETSVDGALKIILPKDAIDLAE